MRYEITSPDGKRFEVTAPDGASQHEVLAYAQAQFNAPKERPASALDGMSGVEKFLAGTGKGMKDVLRGAQQMFGAGDQAEINDARKRDAELTQTGPGFAGNIAGNVAALLPASFVPGANSVAGAAAIGGLSGLTQPTVEGESRLANTAMGAALGGGAQYGLGKIAGAAGQQFAKAKEAGALQASQNAVKDATLREAQAAGYKVPPSQAGAGVLPRVLEGISGKYKTNQAMAIGNQNVTDRLARQALGLADDAPLTRETMQVVRDKAFQSGYEPLANAGAVETDKLFQKSLDAIVKDYHGASRSFPGAVKNDVMERVDSLRTGAFDVGDGLSMIRVLREEANKAYAGGDKALGKATKKAANAIEDQIERALQAAGEDGAALLKNFRESRELMAKAHSVEKALVESGGKVNARVLGQALQRGKPLSGELKTIGAFANNFKDVSRVPESGWANPITVMDAFGTSLGGAAGMGMGAAALPAARIGSRALLSNPMVQKSMGPTYGPGWMGTMTPKMLEELRKRAAGGLLAPSILNAE
jgi:hypothetical protein